MPIDNEITKAEFDKEQKRLKREKHEIRFARQLELVGYQECKHENPDMIQPGEYFREYRWHPKRRWRTDFLICLKDHKQFTNPTMVEFMNPSILVEIEGGTHSRGRHTRGKGYAKDCEKYNHAILEGWLLFRFTGEMVTDGSALQWLVDHLMGGE